MEPRAGPELSNQWGEPAPVKLPEPRKARQQRVALLSAIVGIVVVGIGAAWLQQPAGPLVFLGLFVLGPAIVAIAVGILRRQERAERALRELAGGLAASEERFRVIVRDAADITIVTDAGGQALFTSPAVTGMLGYDPDEIVGTNVLDLLHPDDVEPAITGLADLALEGMVYPLTVRVRRADGEYSEVEAIGANQLDNPAIGGLVITVRDVSERNRTIAQLADAEERFANAFEHAPIGMVVTDADGTVLRSNRALEDLLGRTSEELTGMRMLDLTHPDDRDQSEQELQRLVAGTTERYQIEKRYLRPDGSVVWSSLSVSLMRDADGAPRYTIGQLEDVTERRAMVEQLSHQAIHDSLTGLPNRVLFMDRLRTALGRCRRHGARVAVVFVDLDRFKLVNDSLGHAVGDRLLAIVAGRIGRAVRPTDTVARFGGDEFTVLLEDIEGEDDAIAAATRVSEALDNPVQLPEGEVFVTASLGIALSSDTDTASTLLRDADTAMYRAKEQGRARIEVFDSGTRDQVVDSLRTVNALHRALERGELRVYYQPLVEIRTGRAHGFEALVRWQLPERGLLLPDAFIPIAEESGLIVPIGIWVLETACDQVRAWERQTDEPVAMAVNLSPRQLADPGLTDAVAEVLARTRVDPSRVTFEITETALMQDPEHTASVLHGLRELGVSLAVDDFGTGYSSLSHLKRFPVSALKVDRSFVDGLGTDPEDTAIVAAVVSLAHSLGLIAVAEGVENDVQLAELLTLGCDDAQGYYFSRPVPAEEIDIVRLMSPTPSTERFSTS